MQHRARQGGVPKDVQQPVGPHEGRALLHQLREEGKVPKRLKGAEG